MSKTTIKKPFTKERQAFEQTVLRALKSESLRNHLLIAVSGGVDSMVLLAVAKQWERTLKTKITAAYIHHGGKSAYRARAQKLVETYCKKNDIPFLTNTPPLKTLKSEDDLRQYRWAELRKIAGETDSRSAVDTKAQTPIATAHHADDLIETQLLRLLRGTGAQGLKAFTAQNSIKPLIAFTKEQIQSYAKTKKIKFIEDPSNQQTDPLRNWLRQAWLQPLSKRDKQQKSNLKKSLAGSLAALASQATEQSWPSELFIEGSASKAGSVNAAPSSNPNPEIQTALALHTPTFLQLTRSQKEAALATYMFRLQLKNYTKNHISEVLKRLDTSKKELTFHLLGRMWHVNAQHITTRSLDIPTR